VEREVVAIDGKTVRRSGSRRHDPARTARILINYWFSWMPKTFEFSVRSTAHCHLYRCFWSNQSAKTLLSNVKWCATK
jgi:hypothetical protein